MSDIKLSIIIVSYNTCELTLECIRSVKEQTQTPVEIIVVDNASADSTVPALREQFTDVQLIAMEDNLGFAAANNLAAKQAKGKYILLLNSDTVVLDGAIDKALAYIEAHEDIGVLGVRTLYEDRSLNATSCFAQPSLWSSLTNALGLSSLMPGSALFNPEHMGNWQRDSLRDVGAITGCFFLLKRELWEQLEGFDEAFFMYSEDTDLSARVLKQGLRCVHYPDAEIIHYGGRSDSVRVDKIAKVLSARVLFMRKHWSGTVAAIGCWLVDVQVYSRYLLLKLAGKLGLGSAEALHKWKEIWRRRSMWRRIKRYYAYSGPATHPELAVPGSPLLGRARLAYRWLRFSIQSTLTGYWDFVGNAFKAITRLSLLSLKDLFSPKKTIECNICGWKGSRFYPNTGPGYYELDTLCPACAGLDRHRSLLAVLTSKTDIFTSANRVVEVAPMRGFESICLAQPKMDYTSFDLARRAMEQGDITAMRFEDNSVDYFICFHVLEHIPDVDKALSEIRRILRPGGAVVLQVPIKWDLEESYEYGAPDPRDVGHVRQYGTDFAAIIESHGFRVVAEAVPDIYDAEISKHYGLSPEPIYLAYKPEAVAIAEAS